MSHQQTQPARIDPAQMATMRAAVVVSRYHGEITGPLAEAAAETFCEAGGLEANLTDLSVTGSWELIATCRALANAATPPDCIVALGRVITGEPTHDQFINTAVSNALAQIIVETGVPIAFGVLTCQSMEQAKARAGGSKGNKGAEAMVAAIEAAATIRSIRQ